MINDFNSQAYVDLGYMNVIDNVVARTINPLCNCFGYQFESNARWDASEPHLYEENTLLWFPKLYRNDEWDNKMSFDENVIFEKNVIDLSKTTALINEHLGADFPRKCVVFAHVMDSNGDLVYRFYGLYRFSKEMSLKSKCVAWKRIATSVKTYSSKEPNLKV